MGVKPFLGGRYSHHSFRSSVQWCWDWAWLTGWPYWSSLWLFSNALYPVMMGGNCLIIKYLMYVSGTSSTTLSWAGHALWANCAGKCQEKTLLRWPNRTMFCLHNGVPNSLFNLCLQMLFLKLLPLSQLFC